MALRSDITGDALWFRGEDKKLQITLYADAGRTTIVDASGFALSWRLASAPGAAALVTKTSGSGINVSGAFNADPTLNAQVVEVAIDDTDTDGLTALAFWHELKRTDAGLEAVLVHGRVTLLAPVHIS